jgi:hypothetical protein
LCQPGLRSAYLLLLHSLQYRYVPSCPTYWLRWGSC